MKKIFCLLIISCFLFTCTKSKPKQKFKPKLAIDNIEDVFLIIDSNQFSTHKLANPAIISIQENRPSKGYYYFYNNNKKIFGNSIEGEIEIVSNDNFNSILSERKIIGQRFVNIDFNYIPQIFYQDDIKGDIGGSLLKSYNPKIKTDLMLIFRRIIHINSEKELPTSFFLSPNLLISSNTLKEIGRYELTLINEGILYDVKNEHIYNIKPTSHQIELPASHAQTSARELKTIVLNSLEEFVANTNSLLPNIIEPPSI